MKIAALASILFIAACQSKQEMKPGKASTGPIPVGDGMSATVETDPGTAEAVIRITKPIDKPLLRTSQVRLHIIPEGGKEHRLMPVDNREFLVEAGGALSNAAMQSYSLPKVGNLDRGRVIIHIGGDSFSGTLHASK